MPRRRYLSLRGRTLTVADWAREFRLPAKTLFKGIECGMLFEQALALPVLSREQCGHRAVPATPWAQRGFLTR